MTEIKCDYLICYHNNKKGKCKRDDIKINVRGCEISGQRSIIPECREMEIFNENWEDDPEALNKIQMKIAIILSHNVDKKLTAEMIEEKINEILPVIYDSELHEQLKPNLEEMKDRGLISKESSEKKIFWSLTEEQRIYLDFIVRILSSTRLEGGNLTFKTFIIKR